MVTANGKTEKIDTGLPDPFLERLKINLLKVATRLYTKGKIQMFYTN